MVGGTPTVSSASELFVKPNALETLTTYWPPSLDCTLVIASRLLVAASRSIPPRLHWYCRGGVPVAVTSIVIDPPRPTTWLMGWTTFAGGTPKLSTALE